MMRFLRQSSADKWRRLEFVGDEGRDVLVDIGPTGQEEWWARFVGDSRWHDLDPSTEERSQVAKWRLEASRFNHSGR